MMRKFFVALACCSAFAAHAGSEEYPFHFTPGDAGVQRWAAPDTIRAAGIKNGESVAYARFIDGLGVEVARGGTAALADARGVGLLAKMGVNAAGAMGAASAIMGGPLGWTMAGIMLLPAFIDWINEDHGAHIRFDPTGGIQKTDPSVCSTGPCYSYRLNASGTYVGITSSTSASAACASINGSTYNGNPLYHVTSSVWNGTVGGGASCHVIADNGYNGYAAMTATSVAPQSASWLPASMDDIAPYMGLDPIPLSLIPQILAAGGSVPGTPSSVTTTSSPPALIPSVRTTKYPAPPDTVSPPVVTPGNPFGLPVSTPTVTGNGTGFGVLGRPGQSTITGSPWPSTSLPPLTVNSPSHITTTSTFDGTNTTSTTTTHVDPQTLTETATGVTTLTNTATGSTATTTTTVGSVLTNDTTGASTTTTTTTVGTAGGDKPQLTDCDKIPDSVGCTELGMPPTAENLPKSTVAVTLTPTVFASSASCPGDSTVPINIGPFHSSATFSYAALCSAATGTMAPIVLLLGAAAAAFVFVGGLKS